jgi:hypothetical protein
MKGHRFDGTPIENADTRREQMAAATLEYVKHRLFGLKAMLYPSFLFELSKRK